MSRAYTARPRHGTSNVLRVAVTFRKTSGSDGPISRLRAGKPLRGKGRRPAKPEADPAMMKKAAARFKKLGFDITRMGAATLSVRAKRSTFEQTFGTKLQRIQLSPLDAAKAQFDSFLFPGDEAPWEGNAALEELIDDAYIQWPHVYMNQRFAAGAPSPLAPPINFHHLRVPGDVSLLLGADKVHRAGITGDGVRVCMIDSGFAHGHAYFQERGYNSRVVLAPGANRPSQDGNGHGTGESANLLAMAPDVEFIGIKLDNETNPALGASILEGFQTAMDESPQVISISLGFDLRSSAGLPLTALPNSLVALDQEILQAVLSGVTVVISAGNGHIAFPGMMPEVVSAGGVFIDPKGRMEASNYASAFVSSINIYGRRRVPDCSGLVGRAANNAAFVALPIPEMCEIDLDGALTDGTQPNDGWGVFSGTSAAAPQIAGACALLLQHDSSLNPFQVRDLLTQSARRVKFGSANPASNPGKPPLKGAAATGGGLVDIDAAVRLV